MGYALETVLKMFCGSGVEKRCAQTHEMKLRKLVWIVFVWSRVWECENKQLDPGIEIMSTILNSQVRKPGLGKEKYASRPAQGRKPGLEMEK